MAAAQKQARSGTPTGRMAAASGRQTWVDAAPFQAHVAHLMAAAGLTVEAVAVLAGVQPKAICRLMAGRDTGRPVVRRINSELARSLLQVRNSDVRALRCRVVAAPTVVRRVRMLRSSGWSESRLAAALQVSKPSLAALLDGTATTCTALVGLRAAAGLLALGTAGAEELAAGLLRDAA